MEKGNIHYLLISPEKTILPNKKNKNKVEVLHLYYDDFKVPSATLKLNLNTENILITV